MANVFDPIFESHKRSRDELLQCIVQSLEQDQRVVAAWLFGSLGSGLADYLSDIDIFVVVSDDHFEEVASAQKQFVTIPDTAMVTISAPQNAPPEGAFLSVVYDTPTGAHIVDWYWQKQSRAKIPSDMKLLFDRVGLPHSGQPTGWEFPQPIPERTELEIDELYINASWYSIPHLAKYFARSPWEKQTPTAIIKSVKGLSVFLWESYENPGVKLQFLNQLIDISERLVPSVKARGVDVPQEIAPAVRRFLDLVGIYLKAQLRL